MSLNFRVVEDPKTPITADDENIEEKYVADLEEAGDIHDDGDSISDAEDVDDGISHVKDNEIHICLENDMVARNDNCKEQKVRQIPIAESNFVDWMTAFECMSNLQFGTSREKAKKWGLRKNSMFVKHLCAYPLPSMTRRIWPARKPRLKNHSRRMIGSRAEFVGIMSRPTKTAYNVDGCDYYYLALMLTESIKS